MSENQDIKIDDVYKNFGRHTAVGKLMYNTYNALNDKNSYKPPNKLQIGPTIDPHEQHLKLKKERMEKIKAKKNPKIDYPNFNYKQKQEPKINLMRGRKGKNKIQNELNEYYNQQEKNRIDYKRLVLKKIK